MKRTDLLYVWLQDEQSVSAYFSLQSDLNDSEISVALEDGSFSVQIDGDRKLYGDFPHQIRVEGSKWWTDGGVDDDLTSSVKRLVLPSVCMDRGHMWVMSIRISSNATTACMYIN